MRECASSDGQPLASPPAKIGPGWVVLVVGPSGAGKDALIAGVRPQRGGDPRVHFAERIVSRPEHAAEAHASGTAEAMQRSAKRGDYALTWPAHGLIYGIPVAIDDHVRAGSAVIFNASRMVIGAARARYANVGVILIDAPLSVRAERLQHRGRESLDEIRARLERTVASFDALTADAVVDNGGRLEDGILQLAAALNAVLDRRPARD